VQQERIAAVQSDGSRWTEGAALFGVAMLFLLPFVQPYHAFPLPSFEAEWLAGALLSATLLIAALAAKQKDKAMLQWPLPAFLLGLLALGAVHWVSGRLSYSYALSNLAIAVIAVLGAYLLGRWLVHRGLLDVAMAAASAALVTGGLVSVGLQCLQVLGIQGLPEWLVTAHAQDYTSQPYANVGQPNHLATYLALGVVAAIYLDSQAWPRIAVRIALLLLAAGVALTGSRMGLMMVLLLALAPTLRPRLTAFTRGEIGWGVSAMLAAGYIAGLLAGRWLAPSVVGSQSTVERVADAAYGDRLTMWADALRITWSSPLTGVGVGEYGQAQYWLARPTSELIGTPYAHNAVLQFAAEFGVIAGIAFAALCLWWLLGDWTRRRASPALVCVVAMVALLGIHAMLEWSLWVLFVAILAGLLFALGEPPLRRAFGLDVRPIFAALGVAGLAWAPLMKADYDTVADAAWNLEFEEGIGYGISKEMIEGLTTNSTATYFKPQSDRFVIRAAPPIRKPVSGTEVERTWKVLTRLPEERTIAVYVAALALDGRVADSLPHVERMRAFAVTPERYRKAEEIVLKVIKDEGATAEPLRAELARWR
jgi:hypothetical protein